MSKTRLSDRKIGFSDPSKIDTGRLVVMVESGINATAARAELEKRYSNVDTLLEVFAKAKEVDTNPRKQKGTPTFRAKGKCGVTGGIVDESRIVAPYGVSFSTRLPGRRVEPWIR